MAAYGVAAQFAFKAPSCWKPSPGPVDEDDEPHCVVSQALSFLLDVRECAKFPEAWGVEPPAAPVAAGVRWERKHSSGWREYSSAVSAKIEEAYVSGHSKVRLRLVRPCGDELHQEHRYPIMEVYFEDMEQYDLWNNKVHAVRRAQPAGALLRLRLAAGGLYRLAKTGRWRRETREEYMQRRKALAKRVLPLLRKEEEDVNKFWSRHAAETVKKFSSRGSSKTFNTLGGFNESFWARIAGTTWFFLVSMLVIVLNVIWIWIDVDTGSTSKNPLDEGAHFYVIESAFCLYYVAEVFIRWMACTRTFEALQDKWFLFDSCLAVVMVVEVWLVPAWLLLGLSDPEDGGVADLAVLRMLKLMRLSRMARLLRAVPEILWLLKGVTQSLRAVSFSVVLLAAMTFIFAVLFKTHFAGSNSGADLEDEYFDTVGESILTLFLFGTLLDGPRMFWMAMIKESVMLGCVFLCFIFLSSLTLLNMLIGIVCEVVQTVSREDQDKNEKAFLTHHLTSILDDFDTNGDKHISRNEFDHLMQIPETHEVLERFGTDPESLILLADQIYSDDDDGLLNFKEFFEVVVRLQGGNRATVKDIVELKVFMSQRMDRLNRRLDMLLRSDAASREAPASSTDACSRRPFRAATAGCHGEATRPAVRAVPQGRPGLAEWARPAEEARQGADDVREAFAQRLEELAAGQRALMEEVRSLRGALSGSGPAASPSGTVTVTAE